MQARRGMPRRPPADDASTQTSLLLGLQTLRQQQETARRELAEASAKARMIQQNLKRIQVRETQLRRLLGTARARQAQQKARDMAAERTRRQQELVTARRRDAEAARFKGTVTSLLTDVRYDTANRRTKRAINRARRKVTRRK